MYPEQTPINTQPELINPCHKHKMLKPISLPEDLKADIYHLNNTFKSTALSTDLAVLNVGLSESQEAFLLKGQVDKMARLTNGLIDLSLQLDKPKATLTEAAKAAIDGKWKTHDDILHHYLP